MSNYESISWNRIIMNLVIYFSPTGGTKRIAEFSSDYLKIASIDITSHKSLKNFDYSINYNYIVFCFPVYSQNIPAPVRSIISRIKTNYIIFLATYGRMGMGNVLAEVAKIQKAIVIGGAYIPTKHTYKEGAYFDEFDKLSSLLDRVLRKETKEVSFPRLHKHIMANIFPNLRSRLGTKLKKTFQCTNCNLCSNVCPTNSCYNGVASRKCIRCLSCLYHCPHKGLVIKYSRFLKLYLKNDKMNETIIY